MKNKLQKLLSFLLNPRLLLCLGMAWLITNGWSYLFVILGGYYRIGWMVAVGSGYLAFLWLPFTPEKLVTIALAILFLRLFFPKDEKTLAALRAAFPKRKRK